MKDFNPPLYDILVLLYFKIFGLSIYLLRATSAIFGALLAPILFLFCFYNFNRSAGWITASLVIFNQKLIIYSQEARPYSLLMLIGFIYFTIGWQIFRHGSEKKTHSYAFILSGAMLLYLHYSAIYFFVACSITWCATIFIHQKKQAILLFKNSFIILLLFSPWLPIVYSDSKKWSHWILMPLPNVGELILRYWNESFPLIIGYILIFALIFSLILVIIKKTDVKSDLFLIFCIPIFFIAIYLSVFYFRGQGLLVYRHTIIALPILCLAIGICISSFIQKPSKVIITVILIFTFSLESLSSSHFYTMPTKEDVRGTVKKLISMQDNYPIVVAGYDWELFDFYFKSFNSPPRKFYGMSYQLAQLEKEQPAIFWGILQSRDNDAWPNNSFLFKYKEIESHIFLHFKLTLFKKNRE